MSIIWFRRRNTRAFRLKLPRKNGSAMCAKTAKEDRSHRILGSLGALGGSYFHMNERLNWSFPYPSQRMPVFARNVVATSQPLAAQAGLAMLQRGGNAVDAAVATAICLTVVEPTMNGIGSDAFAIIWDGTRLHGVNGSGRS